MSEGKRALIRSRIEAAYAREQELNPPSATERAVEAVSDAGKAVTGFVKERPLTAAAGALVLGIAVASLFKAPRRAAVQGTRRAIGFGAIGTQLAATLASEVLHKLRNADPRR